MKIEAINVTDFYIEPGRTTSFRAMTEVKFEGDPRRHLVWVDLTGKELEAAKRLAKRVEQRLLLDPPDLPELRVQRPSNI